MPRFEQIIGGRTEDAPKEKPSRFHLKSIDGGKSKKSALNPEIQIVDSSIIQEERIFAKEEVIKIIEEIAEKEGIKKEQLEIEKEYYDPDGHLLNLIVRVKSGRIKGEGLGNIWYDYMIKGRHKEGFTPATYIMKLIAPKERPHEVVASGIVGRYERGGWKLSPDDIIANPADATYDDR